MNPIAEERYKTLRENISRWGDFLDLLLRGKKIRCKNWYSEIDETVYPKYIRLNFNEYLQMGSIFCIDDKGDRFKMDPLSGIKYEWEEYSGFVDEFQKPFEKIANHIGVMKAHWTKYHNDEILKHIHEIHDEITSLYREMKEYAETEKGSR